jgi:hypothetical protein
LPVLKEGNLAYAFVGQGFHYFNQVVAKQRMGQQFKIGQRLIFD